MKFSVAILLALPLLAVATPTPATGPCTTAPLSCCKELLEPTSPEVTSLNLTSLIDVVVDGVQALVGLNCSPISIVGVGSGSTCDTSPVCCNDNTTGGLVSIGCVPVTL